LFSWKLCYECRWVCILTIFFCVCSFSLSLKWYILHSDQGNQIFKNNFQPANSTLLQRDRLRRSSIFRVTSEMTWCDMKWNEVFTAIGKATK
jgi:hypothetical protein